MALVAAGKFPEAYALIRQRCPLPAACGRVCQHPCEDNCNRGEIDEAVSVRDLKRFVADYIHANPSQYPPAKAAAARLDSRVAIIGGGPAGLTVAADLALRGHRITLFEAQSHLGGMLRYGIPDYRLPEDVLDREIQYILDLGVEARTGERVADPKSLLRVAGADSPAAQFDAVFVAPGAWLGRKMGIPGEDAQGVWEALDFLYKVNDGKPPAIGPNVVVIGGGDVAMDAARCARRLPGVQSVTVAYRRSRAEMPAHSWEAAEALEEGVVFHTDLGPARIETADGKVSAIAFHPRIAGSGPTRRTEPRFDESQTTVLKADTVIAAIGQAIDSAGMGVATGSSGRIAADKSTLATSIAGIFAGGDAVLGPASIADAMGQGHVAAEAIDAYLRGGKAANAPSATAQAAPARNPKPGAPREDRVQWRRRTWPRGSAPSPRSTGATPRSRPLPKPNAAWRAACAASAWSA